MTPIDAWDPIYTRGVLVGLASGAALGLFVGSMGVLLIVSILCERIVAHRRRS